MLCTYDMEFLEDGHTLDLISIGIVREDGAEYYAVCSQAPWGRIALEPWLCKNVVPGLPLIGRIKRPFLFGPRVYEFAVDTSDSRVKPRRIIANEVRDFLLEQGTPELWADTPAYDHVLLCQLWGRMIDLPDGIPYNTLDIRHEAHMRGHVIPEQPHGTHHALSDARHVMDVLRGWGKVAGADSRIGFPQGGLTK